METISTLKVMKLRQVKLPRRAHPDDAGIDFFVPDDHPTLVLKPGDSCLISGGVKVQVPKGHALIFFNKSGVAAKMNLVLGSCVVDSGYEGELMYNLHNIGSLTQTIEGGQKIVQGILLPIQTPEVTEVGSEADLFDTRSDRGEGGFGSTGGN